MKRLLSALVVVGSLFVTSLVYADSVKIGVVDMNQVLQKAPLMLSLNADLIKTFKPRQDTLNTQKQDLQNTIDQLTLKGASMSQAEQAKLQDKIITEKAEVAVTTANLDRDLTIAKNTALQSFMTKLGATINKIAQTGQYDIIQQTTNLAYVNKNLDITQQVIQQLQ